MCIERNQSSCISSASEAWTSRLVAARNRLRRAPPPIKLVCHCHASEDIVHLQGDVGIATGIPEVTAALKAGQDAGRLPHLTPGSSVEALIKALTLDGLGVSKLSTHCRHHEGGTQAGLCKQPLSLKMHCILNNVACGVDGKFLVVLDSHLRQALTQKLADRGSDWVCLQESKAFLLAPWADSSAPANFLAVCSVFKKAPQAPQEPRTRWIWASYSARPSNCSCMLC